MYSEEKERIDEIEQYYKPIERLEKWNNNLFWVSSFLSIVVLYIDKVPLSNIKIITTVIFIVCVVSGLVFSLYLRFNLIPKAEEKRRKQLLSNSFGIPLTHEQTQKYYNNQITPSIKKLGANILENSFFAKEICSRMAIRERIKIICYITIWILAAIWRDTPIDLLLVITQIIFSGEILGRFISLELLRYRNEHLFEELYRRGTTVIFATHDSALAANYPYQELLIQDKRVVLQEKETPVKPTFFKDSGETSYKKETPHWER